jgi:hypothetical protein
MRRSVGLSAIAVLSAGTLALAGCSSGGAGSGGVQDNHRGSRGQPATFQPIPGFCGLHFHDPGRNHL